MGITHTHEAELNPYDGTVMQPEVTHDAHCVGYCDRPSSDNENAGLDGGCPSCDQEFDDEWDSDLQNI